MRELKGKIFRTALYLCVFMIPFFIIGNFFKKHFLIWVIWESSLYLVGLIFGLALTFMKLIDGIKPIQTIFARVTGVIISLTILSLFFSGFLTKGLRDIDSYYSKDYKKVEGLLEYVGRLGKDREQTIEVNNIELINTHRSLRDHEGEIIEFTYLPTSKFIVDYQVK